MKHIPPSLTLGLLVALALAAVGMQFELQGADRTSAAPFKGRIAWSADGNHNDPDDWIASPVALAIFAEAGLRDRVVHFDYNSILPLTDPEWEGIHEASVLGAARRYGFDTNRFFNWRRAPEAAAASLTRAVNVSTTDDPLFLVIAGPMEAPLRGLLAADPARLRHVYCISHSRWNDGFATNYQFKSTKRSVIETGARWVQIPDQNARLSFGKYGRPSPESEFAPYFWLRDAPDEKLRFLWERMIVSTRPDPSDAGMAWFVATGDEACTPEKLRTLLERHQPAPRIAERPVIRMEAENFVTLDGCELEHRNDRSISHRICVKLSPGVRDATLATKFDEPCTADAARYEVRLRSFADPAGRIRLTLRVNDSTLGDDWTIDEHSGGWQTHSIPNVALRRGDRLTVTINSGNGPAKLDYLELHRAPDASKAPSSAAAVFPSRTWATRTPKEAGMDAAKIDAFAERVGGDGVLIKDGFLVKSWGDATARKDWASAAKPVLSTLLLLAVQEGKLSGVDAHVQDLGWALVEKDRSMTFRHLANMVSGYACPEAPGAAWGYNDFGIQLYGRSLERVFGQSLDAAIRSRLAPLQFEDGEIFGSRNGIGVHASPRDFARLGWLWLNEGRWNNRTLIEPELFTRHIQPGVPASLPRTAGGQSDYLNIGSYGGGTDQTPHGPGAYGFNFWFNNPVGAADRRAWPALPVDAYQANGMWNRDTVTIIPSLRMVVAVRRAKLGAFEPGKADGEANGNLKLVVE